MKRFLLTIFTVVLSGLAISSTAHAKQVNTSDLAADLNGDGSVSLLELELYNRDQRGN
ncbi:MAG: hypothetical protein HC800_14315 [Phormidesmis sp. RL_2_1]|nr:hypothetical protein [Phormidesmis sp. RL_2_1]